MEDAGKTPLPGGEGVREPPRKREGGGAWGVGIGIVPVVGAACHVGLLVQALAVGGRAWVIVARIPGPLRRVIARVAITVTRVVVGVCM